jgi:isoquinoline 1-oxidoreductase beta subunit
MSTLTVDQSREREGLSRRNVLKTTGAAGAALLVGFNAAKAATATGEQDEKDAAKPHEKKAVSPFRSWVRIDQSGQVTLLSGRSEMGQGISSALPMVLAEELGVDWRDIKVEQAPNNPELFGEQGTGGSGSVAGSYQILRQAGAAARTMLVTAAAQKWQVKPEECIVSNGVISHNGSSARFGELVEVAATLPVPDLKKVPLRDPKDFAIIGKENLQRKDIPSKTDGSAKFGLDVRVPGMVFAMVERCPTFGGKVKSFDAAKAKSMPGVIDVFDIPAVDEGVHSWGGVAVVADSTWRAMEARKALKIEWDLGPHAQESSESLRKEFRRLVDSPMKVVYKQGDTEAAMAAAPPEKRVEADYELPFQAHATMEPMNCTVFIEKDRAEAWAPAQGPEWVTQVVAQVAGLKPEQVKVNTTLMGGGFGRRYQGDFALEAAQIAKRVPRPVQLVWTREDDMTHDYYRPASYHRLSGALDADGNITAWRYKSSSTSIADMWDKKSPPESSELGLFFQNPYLTKNYQLEYLPVSSGVPRAWWRSVEASSIGFVMESYVDELAHAAGMDPYEFRVKQLGNSRQASHVADKNEPALNVDRLRGVLEMAAKKGGWGTPLEAGRGRGIACHYSFHSYTANVAEVSVDKGNIRVHRIVSVVDIGQAVHPDGVRAQVESAIVYGLTAALKSEITIKNGGAAQNNFNRFTTLSMKETPRMEVHIMPSPHAPTGIGEPGLPPVAPAVMNAVFALTGKRIRRLPAQASDLG